MQKRWDIFCKIVDNFGDIGVCWRLAKQLQVEHGLQIRLWIDYLEAAQKLIPSLNVAENSQICEDITVLKWSSSDKTNEADFSKAADVVVEAFACGLPTAYLAAMARQQSKWVNLEYLSAENWVDDFHAKPSPQPNGLTRYFYFPGFTDATGGLIRERDIAAQAHNHPDTSFPRRRESNLNKNSRWIPAFAPQEYSDLLSAEALAKSYAGMTEVGELECTLKIALFCYPNAPIKDLFNALRANSHEVSVYVPESGILPQIADYFGVETIGVGDYFSCENLHVHILPFMSQADYDALLRDCDLNFVRGEDSWVRAIWAGKPFIWQPYLQDENTHIKKLNAFLDLFYANFDAKEMVCEAHRCWSVGQMPKQVWNTYLKHLPAISSHTLQQSEQLAKQPDLASQLVDFCNTL